MLILVGKMLCVNLVFVYGVLIGGEICYNCKGILGRLMLKGPYSCYLLLAVSDYLFNVCPRFVS